METDIEVIEILKDWGTGGVASKAADPIRLGVVALVRERI
jgi:hypothetical protein